MRAAVDCGEAYSSPATRGSKKDSDKAITPALRQSMSLHTWHHQSSCDQSSSTTFRLNPHWGRVATCKKKKKKKSLASIHSGCFSYVQLFVNLWTVICQVSLSGVFSRQEYWSILVTTGCHTLLKHYISCCPSCQLPLVPSASRTPATQAIS